jgi:iron(III) transport system substrate-binding protein
MLQKGEDYIKKLYAQEIFQTEDNRPINDNMARGTYPISLTMGENDVVDLQQQGFPIMVIWPEDVPRMIGAAGSHLSLIDGHPHPNAAKLWANWFASREGQEMFEKAAAKPSLRVDVSHASIPSFSLIRPGEQPYDVNSWEFSVENTEAYQARLREVLGVSQ